MKLIHSYRVLRFSLVLFAILAQCVALTSIHLLVVAGTLAALSWYVTEGPRGKSIPPWISRLLVLAVFMFSVIDAFGPVTLLPLVLGRFVVWLTVIKLYGNRTIENEAQLLLLSMLLMAVAALYATDFLFGILLILWSGAAAWIVLLYQLHHGMESMRVERYLLVPLEHPAPWTRPVTGLHAGREFRKTAFVLLAIGFIGSLSFFVVVPRETLDVLPSTSLARHDGLERMELKPDRDILLSNKQVMSVSLKDMSGNPVHLSHGLRLRGTVLDEYRGGGVWETGRHIQSTVATSNVAMQPLTMDATERATLIMEVVLHQPVGRVFSLYRPVGIETIPPSRVTTNLANGTMGLARGASGLQSYRLEIDLENIVTSPVNRQVNLYRNEEVRSLAIKVLNDSSIDESEIPRSSEVNHQAAMAFESYLRSSEFSYSTDGSSIPLAQRIALEQDTDPVATFLLKQKRGHCEFFAASMAAMCDTVGLPARIVTGYYADRWDDASKSYIVLDRDAHAWVEVETSPLGWLSFDPTPASEGAPTWQQPMTLAQTIRFNWQRWEMSWQANVVGYDASAQKKLLELADPYWRKHVKSMSESINTTFMRVVAWFDIGTGGRLWIDLVMGAAALAGSAFIVVRWRRKKTRKALRLSLVVDEDVTVASVEFYARLQNVFSRHGFVRPAYLPTQSWIVSLGLRDDVDIIALQLTEMYYRIRYGGYRPARSVRFHLMQSVQQLDQLLQKELK